MTDEEKTHFAMALTEIGILTRAAVTSLARAEALEKRIADLEAEVESLREELLA